MCHESRGLSRDEWLTRFDRYLRDVRGLRPGSRTVYRRHVGVFLANQFSESVTCDVGRLAPTGIWDFINAQAAKRESRTVKTVLPAIRSFLRRCPLEGYRS